MCQTMNVMADLVCNAFTGAVFSAVVIAALTYTPINHTQVDSEVDAVADILDLK